MEKKQENETETGIVKGACELPSTLGSFWRFSVVLSIFPSMDPCPLTIWEILSVAHIGL